MDLPARKTDGIEDEEESISIAGRGGNGVPPSIHRP
jgi:hypothetical protein